MTWRRNASSPFPCGSSSKRRYWHRGSSYGAEPDDPARRATRDRRHRTILTGSHILRVVSPDEKGLIKRITEVLLAHGLNIVVNNEFVDPNEKRFFMRTEIEETEVDVASVVDDLRGALPGEAVIEFLPVRRKMLVVMATREYHCLGDLLMRATEGAIEAEIMGVVSNREELAGLVSRFDVPFHHLPAEGRSREEHEREILRIVQPLEPDYIILAKYMRILTGGFIERYPERIVNIHHSFLPAFAGAGAYRQAYARGVKMIGATAHFVTEDLDAGPIIAQDVKQVTHVHGPEALEREGREIERSVLARAVELLIEDRVFISETRTIVFD